MHPLPETENTAPSPPPFDPSVGCCVGKLCVFPIVGHMVGTSDVSISVGSGVLVLSVGTGVLVLSGGAVPSIQKNNLKVVFSKLGLAVSVHENANISGTIQDTKISKLALCRGRLGLSFHIKI